MNLLDDHNPFKSNVIPFVICSIGLSVAAFCAALICLYPAMLDAPAVEWFGLGSGLLAAVIGWAFTVRDVEEADEAAESENGR